jgi:hypothetical protein
MFSFLFFIIFTSVDSSITNPINAELNKLEKDDNNAAMLFSSFAEYIFENLPTREKIESFSSIEEEDDIDNDNSAYYFSFLFEEENLILSELDSLILNGFSKNYENYEKNKKNNTKEIFNFFDIVLGKKYIFSLFASLLLSHLIYSCTKGFYLFYFIVFLLL